MRPIAFGLAVALIVGALTPAVVMSASKKEEAALAEARKLGMEAAPAIAQGAGLTCKVVDARLMGKNTDAKTKISTSFYEIDCDQGLGFVLQTPAGGKATAFSCIEANSPQPDGKPPSAPCKLAGNADPKADLAPLIAKAGVSCVPDAARGIGQSSTSTYVEVSCQGGTGYVLQAGLPANPGGASLATNCLIYDASESNIKCVLHDKASRLTAMDTYIAAANNGCVPKDRRYVGLSQGGATYWEASCQDGKGYIYKIEKNQLSQAVSCEKASGILGGCELTDTKEAETAQAGLYTKLAQKAGFDCQVSKYAPFPSPAGKDVVELVCSNRPDGGVGVFAGPNAKSMVVDCARAPIVGYRCSFTKPADAYKLVTDDLKKMGKTECAVSNIRVLGKTAKGTTFLETACADGLKGYILEYTSEPLAPVGVVGCAFSKDCKLPGNT